MHQIPESLLHRVIQRESDYNPGARNGPYYGLMQILPQTARTMGYQRRARRACWMPKPTCTTPGNTCAARGWCRGGDQDEAVSWYAQGYYYEAKRLGLLEETGLRA